MTWRGLRKAFTLIELLVVIAIIGLLVAVLLPALSRARTQAKATVCLTRLRTVGQGLVLYANKFDGALVPGRMPKVDDEQWQVQVAGGLKYRPTFLPMMASQIGLIPFEDPQPTKTSIDIFGQPGDRQNYSHEGYVCPETPEWTDERNGSYGYNYQFLGNSRLRDREIPTSYKNWPVRLSRVRSSSACVAAADGMGTAASYSRFKRTPYEDNEYGNSQSGRTVTAYGNEGFNLDPPRVDLEHGEMALLDHEARTALHERHRGRGNVLWVDGHASSETQESLGYEVDEEGIVGFEGNNRKFNIRQKDEAWIGG